MKLACLLVVLGFVAIALPSHAGSTLAEIKPGRDSQGLSFDIHSELMANGEIQFTVKVTGKSGKLYSKYEASLAIVRIVGDPVTGPVSEEVHPLRPVVSEQEINTIKCVFSATAKELEDLNFAFLLSKPQSNAVDMSFARLKNFVRS